MRGASLPCRFASATRTRQLMCGLWAWRSALVRPAATIVALGVKVSDARLVDGPLSGSQDDLPDSAGRCASKSRKQMVGGHPGSANPRTHELGYADNILEYAHLYRVVRYRRYMRARQEGCISPVLENRA